VESWFGRDQVRPPSAENENMTGSANPGTSRNWVQVRYTRPKNGELGFRSAQMSSLSLKMKPFFATARIGSYQLAP